MAQWHTHTHTRAHIALKRAMVHTLWVVAVILNEGQWEGSSKHKHMIPCSRVTLSGCDVPIRVGVPPDEIRGVKGHSHLWDDGVRGRSWCELVLRIFGGGVGVGGSSLNSDESTERDGLSVGDLDVCHLGFCFQWMGVIIFRMWRRDLSITR